MSTSTPTPTTADTATTPAEWLTVNETAETVRLHPQTVRAAINSGRLAASQVGRAWRIRRSAIDAWMDSLSTLPTDN